MKLFAPKFNNGVWKKNYSLWQRFKMWLWMLKFKRAFKRQLATSLAMGNCYTELGAGEQSDFCVIHAKLDGEESTVRGFKQR